MAKVFVGHRGIDTGSAEHLVDETRAGRGVLLHARTLEAWKLESGGSRSETIYAGLTSADLLIHLVVTQ